MMLRILGGVFLAVIAGMPMPSPAAGGDIGGVWTLVDQFYGTGGHDLSDGTRPVSLEIRAEAEGHVVTIAAGEERRDALEWPAFVTETGRLPLELLERRVDPAAGLLRAHYRVSPGPEEELVLDIVEEYRLTGAGDLEGSMEVRFTRDGDDRGSYRLYRRFRRQP